VGPTVVTRVEGPVTVTSPVAPAAPGHSPGHQEAPKPERAVLIKSLITDITEYEEKYILLTEANARLRQRQAEILAPILNKGFSAGGKMAVANSFKEWADLVEQLRNEREMREDLARRTEANEEMQERILDVERSLVDERMRGSNLDREIEEKEAEIETQKKKIASYQREIETTRLELEQHRAFVRKTKAYLSKSQAEAAVLHDTITHNLEVLHPTAPAPASRITSQQQVYPRPGQTAYPPVQQYPMGAPARLGAGLGGQQVMPQGVDPTSFYPVGVPPQGQVSAQQGMARQMAPSSYAPGSQYGYDAPRAPEQLAQPPQLPGQSRGEGGGKFVQQNRVYQQFLSPGDSS
jgi:hypothetical protein